MEHRGDGLVEGRVRAHDQADGLVVTTNAHYIGNSTTFERGVPKSEPMTSVSESSKADQMEGGGSDNKTTNPLNKEGDRFYYG